MPSIVGCVEVRMLEANDIHPHDVQECVRQQYGSALTVKYNPVTDVIEFVASDSAFSSRSDCIPTLSLRGRGQTVSVLLMPPFDPTYYPPRTKVVPTRSKKLLLI
jgi:hypothetical protein